MAAVVLTGHGGYDKLEFRTDVATPRPDPDQVLIRVGAARRQQHRHQHHPATSIRWPRLRSWRPATTACGTS